MSSPNEAQQRIEILYFRGCTNYLRAHELVARIAGELGFERGIDLVEVRPDQALNARFLGSPTVRVGGRDVEPDADARRDFSFSCRLYRTDHGVSGLPDAAWIREALTEAAA